MAFTEWFPSKIKPARVGIYEIKAPSMGRSYFSYWDGHSWGYRMHTIEDANAFKNSKCYRGGVSEWRGIQK